MKLLGTYLKSLEMVVHIRAKSKISEEIPRKDIYQITGNTSSRWRRGEVVYHPVTPFQMHEHSFKEGDRVKLRLRISKDEKWSEGSDYTIEKILPYESVKDVLCQGYNKYDSFNKEAFTHALVLTI